MYAPCDDNVSGESEGPVLLGCPQITDLPGVSLLKEQIKTDETLDICRELASKNLNGYMWENDLLFHCILDGACMLMYAPWACMLRINHSIPLHQPSILHTQRCVQISLGFIYLPLFQ